MRPSTPSIGSYEGWLRLLIVTAFCPEGSSIIIGDFRLPLVRIVLLMLFFPMLGRAFSGTRPSAFVPSDFFAFAAGIWMLIACIVTSGFADGTKSAGALALDFTGSYMAARYLLETPNSSVRLIRFSCQVMIVVVALGMLDPLSGHLFVNDSVNRLTGYYKPYDPMSEAIVRNGLVRATGPMEHSILFGAACVWFGLLALCTFRFSLFSIFCVICMAIGAVFSQSRGAQAAFNIGGCLLLYNHMFQNFAPRWKIVIGLVICWVIVVVLFSNAPVTTLLQFGGVDPEAGWYRSGIWMAAGPMVLASPYFGIGLQEWDWRSFDYLMGPSVDSVWLQSSMSFGIVGSLLLFLTMTSAFWRGPLDRSRHLSKVEQRLSVGLGIVVSIAIFLGFTVDYWGTTWILIGLFPGMRAHLAEAAIIRSRHVVRSRASSLQLASQPQGSL